MDPTEVKTSPVAKLKCTAMVVQCHRYIIEIDGEGEMRRAVRPVVSACAHHPETNTQIVVKTTNMSGNNGPPIGVVSNNRETKRFHMFLFYRP